MSQVEISSKILDIVFDEKELIFNFFVTFSRFEYALKISGYMIENETVWPDWKRFIEENYMNFDKNHSSIAKSYEYLDSDPVKKQILDNSKNLGWKVSQRGEKDSDMEWAIKQVKTIRNNLFHGGKIPFDPDRDSKLLLAGLDILEYCANFNKSFLHAFTLVIKKRRD